MKRVNSIFVITVVIITGSFAGQSFADFILQHSEHLDVTVYHSQGQMYDNSTANILGPNGSVDDLYLYDYSQVNTYADSSVGSVRTNQNSVFTSQGGTFSTVNVYGSSTANISCADRQLDTK